jgi:predicted metalloprotease with PDZ domain
MIPSQNRERPRRFRAALCAEEKPATPLEISYHLRLERPNSHLVEVEIIARKINEPAIDFVIPAWAPGRYAIYDFAKNVQEFAATDLQDQRLAWDKLDKQTWRVVARQAGGTVKIRYKVFANDLSGSFSQFDTSHASLNGASIFMYIAGHKPDPVTLSVEAPAQWKLISGFSNSTEERSFHIRDYDHLIDTPLEISPEGSLEEFQELGKTIRIAVHSYDPEDTDRSKLVEGLKKIVHIEMSSMPAPDFQHYTFIFHFASDIPMGDGMEHLNSTDIIIRGTLRDATPEALEIAAHEFFHLWNVKRLRPAALGPFDYTRENYSQSLWFAEGVTSYFAYLNLLRSGLWTRAQFLTRLGQEISNLELEPGRWLMSAESSSFNAWFYDRSPQMQETNFVNSTISYYNKGTLLGMLLDLEVRSRTQGRESLCDVLAEMYHKFYESPSASYYGPGRGYEEKDIVEALAAVTGSDFNSFFQRYVGSIDPLPYDEALNFAGLKLQSSVAPNAPPIIGALVQPENRGARIVVLWPGSAAERAGLSRDDLLISVDGLSLATEELKTRLKIYPPGAEVPFEVERHGRRTRITVKLDPPVPTLYTIEELPGANANQVALRDEWLGK